MLTRLYDRPVSRTKIECHMRYGGFTGPVNCLVKRMRYL